MELSAHTPMVACSNLQVQRFFDISMNEDGFALLRVPHLSLSLVKISPWLTIKTFSSSIET